MLSVSSVMEIGSISSKGSSGFFCAGIDNQLFPEDFVELLSLVCPEY